MCVRNLDNLTENLNPAGTWSRQAEKFFSLGNL
jgi:hypothetical protein